MSKLHASETFVGVRFACWPVSNGQAWPAPRRRGVGATVSRFAGWRFSYPKPRWQRRGTSERHCEAATTNSLLSPKISIASSTIGRRMGEIEQLRILRPAWCSTCVVLDLRLQDTDSVLFPVDVVPSKQPRFRGCPQATEAT